MVKHTSGPWDFVEGNKDRGSQSVVRFKGQDDFPIAYVVCEAYNVKQRAEDIANARLIAAAPDLLQILEAIVEDVGHGGGGAKLCEQFLVRAKATIAKATK